MSGLRLRFGDFILDTANRSLLREGHPLALNARYFDALVLLVREQGRLVGKQRFFDEVWTGSVVSDAALTQCIKDIRRLLGDDASDPRFVRTVPGHGYCFIAAVEIEAEEEAPTPPAPAPSPATTSHALPAWLGDAGAAAAGGAAAGLLGGLLYGSTLAFAPPAQGLGSLSVLLVLLALSMLVGMAGALAVGLGLMSAWRLSRGSVGATLAGATLGGLLVGGLTKLLTSDAFRLLVGQAPEGITGGLEGASLGFAVAAGLLLGGGPAAADGRRPALFAAAAGALAGVLLALAGGSLMAGSLARVAATFDGSRLDLAPLAGWFGGAELGQLGQAALGGLEGGLFGACVVLALRLARRH